jgi:hypothetical protein
MANMTPAPLIVAASVGGFASKSLPEVDLMATLSGIAAHWSDCHD